MENSWPLVKIGDHCSKIGSGATPRGGSSVYQDSGEICLVRSQNIYNNGFKFDGLVYIDEDAATKLKNVVLEPNDILLNITGDSVARVCLVDERVLPARVNQHVAIIRPNPSDFDARFLRYYLASPYAQALLLNLASAGATRNALTKSMIENFEAPKPSIDVQSKIADHLEALELKILSNQEVNQTLEQMAQVLFKSWFVDFDPVFDNALSADNDIPEALQQKAEQRKQAQKLPDFKPLPDDIRSLFPSEFEQMGDPNIGIAGWIPQGWNFDSFSNIATLKTLSVHPNRDPDKTWTHFSLPAFDSGKSPTQDIGIEIKSGKYRVSDSIVLVSKLNPNTPRVWLPNVVDTESSVCSTEFMPFEPLDKSHRAYIYSLMCSDRVQSEIASRVTGTTGSHQRVSPKNIAILPIILPSEVCINLYCQMVKDFFSKVESNMEQNAELDKLRDILLPKLISGELKLNN